MLPSILVEQMVPRLRLDSHEAYLLGPWVALSLTHTKDALNIFLNVRRNGSRMLLIVEPAEHPPVNRILAHVDMSCSRE